MKFFVGLFLLFSSIYGFAHSFHVGLAQVDYEEEKEMLFCTIQLESGDLYHWLEDLNLDFNLEELAKKQQKSPDWQAFAKFLGKHFSAQTNHHAIEFMLFGLDLELDGRLFIYVYAEKVKPFSHINWTFSLLMGHSMEQQNRLEFCYIRNKKKQTYFVYFFESEPSQTIHIKTEP
jgi:hypothetical protein